MRKGFKKMAGYFFHYQKKLKQSFFKKVPFVQGSALEFIFKKYTGHFFIILTLIFLSFIAQFLPLMFTEKPQPLSIDKLIPKGFVLLPIEISNGQDIISLISSYGVVDLYVYSANSGLPEQQAAGSVKILPPDREEGYFSALIPEKEAIRLFSYSEPFYAVVQNPDKKGAKVYKKKKTKSLIIVEEDF